MADVPVPSDSSSVSASVYEAARREKLRRIVELGHDPWGQRFDDRGLIGDIRQRIGEVKFVKASGETIELPAEPAADPNFRTWIALLGPGEIKGPQVRAAGRVMLQRDTGKLRFVNIQDWSGNIQLFIGKAQVGDDNWALAENFDLGDLIGVDGELRYTKTGELTIFAQKLYFHAKSIETPPEKHAGLSDPELRHRMRYLDLVYTEGVLERMLSRTKVVQSIRTTLAAQNFVEIEGPTLHAIAGGAAARPFVTHHNTLDMQLYLRIALELHLKRLLVGGMERVYELGRVFRNEGVSLRHNPEFTMLEVYQAYGDYGTMMDLTEKLLLGAIDAIGGGYQRPWVDKTIDFTPPLARRTYDELFLEHTGVDPTNEASVREFAEQIGLDTQGKHPDVVKSEVFEAKVEDALVGPVFVTDYPASICPLTKRKASNPAVAERFELFIQGMEVANAYTELNDPDLQEQLFRTQLTGQADEDSMAKMDHDFIRALRHGMPPAGGLGIGIDRLVMLLTNTQSIREVLLFPLMRRKLKWAGDAPAEPFAKIEWEGDAPAEPFLKARQEPRPPSSPSQNRAERTAMSRFSDVFGTEQPVALVTGSGAKRVGNAIVQTLAARGYRCVVHANQSLKEAEAFVAKLRESGVEAIVHQANLIDTGELHGLVDKAFSHFGQLNVLVNSAAIWESKRLEEITPDDVRRHFEINTLATFELSRYAGLKMVAQTTGGAIINIGDWAVARPYLDYAAYFPSKGAIPTLTRALAVELAARNPRIRVNAVLPGPVMLPPDLSAAERQSAIEGTLVKREGTSQHVADAVVFLAENDFVTGICLPVDGGRTIAP